VVDVDRPGDRCRDVGWWLRQSFMHGRMSRSTARMVFIPCRLLSEKRMRSGLRGFCTSRPFSPWALQGSVQGQAVVYFAGVAVAGLLAH